jgi:ABC-type lipoprotein export system ATPase subunit
VTNIAYPRGSEWRKWDLQVHTPYSALNNGFGTDFDEYAKTLINRACEKHIAVVGITDYFMIEGYIRLRELLDDKVRLTALVGAQRADAAGQILFLPNVELRTSIIVRDLQGKDSRVNFHVVFSDTVSPTDIDENFLRELKFTAEANPDSADERWPLTRNNLSELGQRLQRDHPKFQNQTPLFTGMMNAVIDHSQVSEVLDQKPSIFREKYLLCTPCDEDLSTCSWDGQGHLARKLLIQKSHALFSPSPGTRQFALGQKHASQKAFVDAFKGLKPCIHSSDAHRPESLFQPNQNRHTWIKADPTFRGLRQILHEPEDRVFIGETPPSLERISKRPTRVVKQLEIRKTSSATLSEKWFDSLIPLSAELVAVIGNKGSGKSALSDVLGLLGNTPRGDAFSFLTPKKFRKVKDNKARSFRASLTWVDGTLETVDSLDSSPDRNAVEKIKYIPQSYLEDICNEIGEGKGSRFDAELQHVIFSHVPENDRAGFGTLDELLQSRAEETREAIGQHVRGLSELNAKLVEGEAKLLPQHQASLDALLAERTRELAAHESSIPGVVMAPDSEQSAEQVKAAEKLGEKQKLLSDIEADIATIVARDAGAARKLLAAEKLLGKVRNLERYVNGVLAEAEPEFAELGISAVDVVKFEVVTGSVDTLADSLRGERESAALSLDPNAPDSLRGKQLETNAAIASMNEELSAPQRQYQAYLQEKKEWDIAKARIVGSPGEINTLSELQAQLTALASVPSEIDELRTNRDRILCEIFDEKQKLRNLYESYYGAVRYFLEQHPLAKSAKFQLSFDVSMSESGFAEQFLRRIDRRKNGPFMGEEDGTAEMRRLLDVASFDTQKGILDFTSSILLGMTGADGRQLSILDQLRQGESLQDLYDYLYSLDYLKPEYTLKWDGKDLAQLSPGERGNLLLIFYLLVDRDDIPLVIDQPEENLDNQTVYTTLVPCIKDAKRRRQIIMVTHNPNLAVVCDAEQVICAEMKKDDGNAVIYTTGSIEDPFINARIVDVLEGTRPAFDKRDDKYIA